MPKFGIGNRDSRLHSIITVNNIIKMNCFDITIDNLRAKNLISPNLVACSPYLCVYVGDTCVGKSDVINRSNNAIWSNTFQFKLSHIWKSNILFKIFTSAVISDYYIGCVTAPIGLGELSTNWIIENEQTIEDGNGTLEYRISVKIHDAIHLQVRDSIANERNIDHSLLPFNTPTPLIEEFTNCHYSTKFSHIFAIDSLLDYSDLFNFNITCQSSSSIGVSNGTESAMMDNQSDLYITGMVYSVSPTTQSSTMVDTIPYDIAVISNQNNTFTEVMCNNVFGYYTNCKYPHHMTWTDRISPEIMKHNYINVSIRKPSSYFDSNKDVDNMITSSVEVYHSGRISYGELLYTATKSTGKNGEMVLDNTLRLYPSNSNRKFIVTVIDNTIVSDKQQEMPALLTNWVLTDVYVSNRVNEHNELVRMGNSSTNDNQNSSSVIEIQSKDGASNVINENNYTVRECHTERLIDDLSDDSDGDGGDDDLFQDWTTVTESGLNILSKTHTDKDTFVERPSAWIDEDKEGSKSMIVSDISGEIQSSSHTESAVAQYYLVLEIQREKGKLFRSWGNASIANSALSNVGKTKVVIPLSEFDLGKNSIRTFLLPPATEKNVGIHFRVESIIDPTSATNEYLAQIRWSMTSSLDHSMTQHRDVYAAREVSSISDSVYSVDTTNSYFNSNDCNLCFSNRGIAINKSLHEIVNDSDVYPNNPIMFPKEVIACLTDNFSKNTVHAKHNLIHFLERRKASTDQTELKICVYENQVLMAWGDEETDDNKSTTDNNCHLLGKEKTKWISLENANSKLSQFSDESGHIPFPSNFIADGKLCDNIHFMGYTSSPSSTDWKVDNGIFKNHPCYKRFTIDKSENIECDAEHWWYAMSIDDLLSGRSCFPFPSPGCIWRRRCWTKSIDFLVSNVLDFSKIHNMFKPPNGTAKNAMTKQEKDVYNFSRTQLRFADFSENGKFDGRYEEFVNLFKYPNEREKPPSKQLKALCKRLVKPEFQEKIKIFLFGSNPSPVITQAPICNENDCADDVKRQPIDVVTNNSTKKEISWGEIMSVNAITESTLSIGICDNMYIKDHNNKNNDSIISNNSDSVSAIAKEYVIDNCAASKLKLLIEVRRNVHNIRSVIQKAVGHKTLNDMMQRVSSNGYIHLLSDLRGDVLFYNNITEIIATIQVEIHKLTQPYIGYLNSEEYANLINNCSINGMFSSLGADGENDDDMHYLLVVNEISTSGASSTNDNITDPSKVIQLRAETLDEKFGQLKKKLPIIQLLVIERLLGYHRLLLTFQSSLQRLLHPLLIRLNGKRGSYDEPAAIFFHHIYSNRENLITQRVCNKIPPLSLRPLESYEYLLSQFRAIFNHACNTLRTLVCKHVEMRDANVNSNISTMSLICNHCILQIASGVNKIITWETPKTSRHKDISWDSNFMNISRFVIDSNSYLLNSLSSAKLSFPLFDILKIPCLLRHVSITSLVKWELKPRIDRLFAWTDTISVESMNVTLQVI
jgi:hypothetical protein